jgi:iron complex transport system substrate-binding protein
MKKTTTVVTAIILILVIVGSSYGVYRLYVPSDTGPQKETVTVVDATGVQVNVSTPVERIISLNPGLTEIICALGCEDRIVGRDASSIFPASILEKPIAGQNSYTPNLELLLELTPDLVVADPMLSSNNDALKKIESAGVPVIIEEPSNVSRVKTMTSNFGLILGKEEKAKEIVDYIESYENLVKERIKNLTPSEKPLVYFEWYKPWYSMAVGSQGHEILVNAGGINIAAEQPLSYPTLSPEYVVEKNPDIIIRMISGDLKGNITGFQTTRNEILSRAGLSATKAVKEGGIYVYDSVVLAGIRYPVGLLYWAKWFHPSLFEDIDPAAIHAQLIQRFFSVTLEGVYAYP